MENDLHDDRQASLALATRELDRFLLEKFRLYPDSPGTETCRWLFCTEFGKDEEGADDCACCFADPCPYDRPPGGDAPCSCICHFRIGQMAEFMEGMAHEAYSAGLAAGERRRAERSRDCALYAFREKTGRSVTD